MRLIVLSDRHDASESVVPEQPFSFIRRSIISPKSSLVRSILAASLFFDSIFMSSRLSDIFVSFLHPKWRHGPAYKSGMASHMELSLHIVAGHTQSPGLLLNCLCYALGNAPVAAVAEETVLCHARDKSFNKKYRSCLTLLGGLSGQISNSGNLGPFNFFWGLTLPFNFIRGVLQKHHFSLLR